jgi:hypothetical protein
MLKKKFDSLHIIVMEYFLNVKAEKKRRDRKVFSLFSCYYIMVLYILLFIIQGVQENIV